MTTEGRVAMESDIGWCNHGEEICSHGEWCNQVVLPRRVM